jgi:hypothetical protein
VADAYAETLAEREAALHVRHIARRPLITVSVGATPEQAARLAAEHSINNLPVVDDEGAVIGVLEDAHRGREAGAKTVGDAMRPLDDSVLVESRRSIDGLLDDLRGLTLHPHDGRGTVGAPEPAEEGPRCRCRTCTRR